MTADSLIEKLLTTLDHYAVDGWVEMNTAEDLMADVIRQHEADNPHAQSMSISPERVQKVERVEHTEQPPDVLERVAEAQFEAYRALYNPVLAENQKLFPMLYSHEKPLKPFAELDDREKENTKIVAKAAIAAMPLRSAGLSDAKGQEEADTQVDRLPAKELGVGVPGAAPSDTLNRCREAFETSDVAASYGLHRRDRHGKYDSSHTQIMWQAWRSAWEVSAGQTSTHRQAIAAGISDLEYYKQQAQEWSARAVEDHDRLVALQQREIRLLNDVLPPAVKYAIADEITTESRSKSDVVQDVWDELVSRGLVREPKRKRERKRECSDR